MGPSEIATSFKSRLTKKKLAPVCKIKSLKLFGYKVLWINFLDKRIKGPVSLKISFNLFFWLCFGHLKNELNEPSNAKRTHISAGPLTFIVALSALLHKV